MNKDRFIPLNLQLFNNKGKDDSNKIDDNQQQVDDKVTEPTKSEDKTFTQEDVNNIATKEARKAQEKVFKELGIEDFENAKEGFKKFQEWQEEQKTDAQRQAEDLEAANKANENLESENATLKAELSALKAGVNTEAISDVVTLAKGLVSEEVDMDAAIKQIVEKYPHFKEVEKEEKEDKKPKFSSGEHKSGENQEDDPFAKIIAKYK